MGVINGCRKMAEEPLSSVIILKGFDPFDLDCTLLDFALFEQCSPV
jgi:hypothetical protein